MNKIIKVIIADDVEIIAQMNKKIIMNNKNVEVIGIAKNGREELEMIINLKPDLVITDNKMPEMNGIEVIEKINNLEIDNKPDFILVTSDNNYELKNECKELNVYSILNKLSSEKELPYIIDEYISIRDGSNKQDENSYLKNMNKPQKSSIKKFWEKIKKGVR